MGDFDVLRIILERKPVQFQVGKHSAVTDFPVDSGVLSLLPLLPPFSRR